MKKNEKQDVSFDRLMSIREAASLLSISERSLWNHTSPRGDIPCIRIGSTLRYESNSLQDWLNRQLRRNIDPRDN